MLAPHRCAASFSVIACLLAGSVSLACDTPVYRYAMYRWLPTPYEVYFFHDQTPEPHDQEVARLLNEYSDGSESRANVIYLPVNLTEDPELNSVPLDVKKVWQAREDKTLPTYVVSTPYGIELYSGALDTASVQSLVESPARQQLARQLEQGKVGVFVLLTCSDEAANKQVEGVLTGLLQEVAEGKVNLYASPNDPAVTGSENPDEAGPSYELGMVKVARDSGPEKWLVRSLLSVESDLEQEDRPMVFLTYGRGRALLPYIGAGITRENLIREVEFITGACSCTVKEQNPGVDLLVHYDWETAAAVLADKFGTEEGNESRFGPSAFFPELIIPSSSGQAGQEVAAANDEPAERQPPDQDVAATENPDVAETGNQGTAGQSTEEQVAENRVPQPPQRASDGQGDDEQVDSSPAATERISPEVAEVAPPGVTSSDDQPAAFEYVPATLSSVVVVGAGVVIALVVLFGVTFLVMRPQ